jgi:hypothetical protein
MVNRRPLAASQSRPSIARSNAPVERSGPALGVVQRGGIVIEADPQGKPAAVTGIQGDQRLADPRPHHRLHGVGQHQHLEAPVEGIRHHARDVRVHERLAAGEADLARAQPQRLDLVEQTCGVSGREIAQTIVLRPRLDVAVEAFDVAQRAGVDPQRIEPRQPDRRPGLALGGDVGIPELVRQGRKVGAVRFVRNVCHGRETSTFP